MPYHLVFDIEMKLGPSLAPAFGKVHVISGFCIAILLQRQIALSGDNLHFLVRIRLRDRNPNPNLLARRQILYRERVVKREVARLLRESSKSQNEQRQ